MKAFCMGSLVRDLIYKVPHFVKPGETLPSMERQVFLGGKGFNQAVALKRAGLEEVCMVGCLGPDGAEFKEYLGNEGVCTEFVSQAKTPTGHSMIQVTPEGQNAIVHFSGANSCIDEALVARVSASLKPGDLVIMQNEITMVPEMINAAKSKGALVAFNPSPCNEAAMNCPLSACDFLIVNELEGEALSGVSKDRPLELLNALAGRFPKAKIVLTLGTDGSYYSDESGVIRQEPYKVKAVDTVGAGDTFLGFLFGGLLKGLCPKEAMDLASRAAAISVTRCGAAPAIPTINETKSYKF